MPRIDNTRFYTNALEKYGPTAKGLNWHDEDSQIRRFEVIVRMMEKDLESDDLIVDAGCGFGDLYAFLRSRYDIRYLGYEIEPRFVEIALARTGETIIQKDILKDPLEPGDFYIASGSMNILSRFETYLFIERCFEHARKGFLFNLPYGKPQRHFNYFLPQEIKRFAKKFGCEILTRSGYLPNDFTVYLKKF